MTHAALSAYATSLAPADYDKTTVSERREALRRTLQEDDLDAGYLFESGSWTHGTALKDHSDVDYMAWATSDQPVRPSTALSNMKAALAGSHWAITGLRVSSPTVKVQFYGDPNFEVVPAWLSRTVGDDNVFWIPGPGDQWVESAPGAHLRFVTDQNKRLNGRVKALARLLKQWKAYTGAPVSSFYLEMRVAEFAKGEQTILLNLDMMSMVDRLIEYGLRDMNDPVGLVARIKAVSSDENRRTTLRRLKEAQSNLSSAYLLDEKPGKEGDYWNLMYDVFGPSFPYPTW